MARRRGTRVRSLGLGFLAFALGAGAWFLWHRYQHAIHGLGAPAAPATAVSVEHVDPANENRAVIVSGSVKVTRPARDTQLGVSADAVALLRRVEMLQWRECTPADGCDYALQWSPRLVDSGTFKKGHENPPKLPFSSERFLADDVRLGAFKLDASLAANAAESMAFPVHVAQLPPNLAVTFRDQDGLLYAGADPAHPAVGDLRVSYRVVVAGQQVHLTAIQDGDHLKSPPVR